jgi:hypothetical protein
MNTLLLCVSDATPYKPLGSNCGRTAYVQNLRRPQKTMIADMLRQNWSTLHSQLACLSQASLSHTVNKEDVRATCPKSAH